MGFLELFAAILAGTALYRGVKYAWKNTFPPKEKH